MYEWRFLHKFPVFVPYLTNLYLPVLILIPCYTNYVPSFLILFLNPSSFILFLTCNFPNVSIFVPIPNTVPQDPKSLSYVLYFCS